MNQTKSLGAVTILLLINITAFIVQNITGGVGGWFTQQFMLVSADVLSRPWILVTSMFLHGSAGHLFFNMYALFLFGTLIEQAIGTKRFLGIYFGAGILAAFIPTYSAALGASGAIMGIIGMTIMLFPNLQVLFLFFIPMSMRTAGIIFAFIDIIGLIQPTQTGIAHFAHLVGLLCGLGYGYYLIEQKKNFTSRFMQNVHSARKARNGSKKIKGKSTKKDSDIEMSDEDIDNYIKYGRF